MMLQNNQSITRAPSLSAKQKTIPWIDMRYFIEGTPEQKVATAIEFGHGMQQIGFVAVRHIGISTYLIDKAYQLAEQYFNQSETTKLKQRAQDGHWGFIPYGTEHAKYTCIRDLKEFYQTTGPTHPIHLWPDLPDFKETMTALYLELENCMKVCLQATAIYLGYTQKNDQYILSNMLGSGNGVMRILHYPPVIRATCPAGATRSAPHEDLSLMTIMPRATTTGLQLQNNMGDWMDVVVPDNAAIINSGDTLSYITNGIIPSTSHRVINPPEHDYSHSYSIPFFASLPFNTVLRVLDKCRGNTRLADLPREITFGDFLAKRYHAIGLIS